MVLPKPLPLRSWTQELKHDVSLEVLVQLSLAHSALAGSEGNAVARLLEDRDFGAIVDYQIHYPSGACPLELFHLRQALAFFQKLQPLEIGRDRRGDALRAFLSAEDLCRQTNQMFEKYRRGLFHFSPRVAGVLHAAQRKISEILGPLPSLDVIRPRVGPGAISRVPKREADLLTKFRSTPACSTNFIPLLRAALNSCPGLIADLPTSRVDEEWEYGLLNVTIDEGTVVFVPKNAKIDRAVVVAPGLNVLFQLGYGDFMARRLAAFGVDLKDQSRNRKLAKVGSIDGSLATVDLSSASDTVARELVYDLLPLDWAARLNMLRVTDVRLEGQTIKLEKFSSMGDGFTFPLETLIFYGLAHACCPTGPVSVYGDDIIIPSASVDLFYEVLNAVGFVVNRSKSFSTGPFRESCGADYYLGFDIRPYYQKNLVSGETLFSLHNFYVRRGLTDFSEMIISLIPEHLRVYGPDGFGDGHLIRESALRPHGRERGWAGFLFDTFVRKGRRSRFLTLLPGDSVLPRYSIYTSAGDSVPVGRWRGDKISLTRPGSQGYKRISIYTLVPG